MIPKSPGTRTMEARVSPTCKLGIPSVPIFSRTCRRVAKELRLQPAVGCSNGQANDGGGWLWHSHKDRHLTYFMYDCACISTFTYIVFWIQIYIYIDLFIYIHRCRTICCKIFMYRPRRPTGTYTLVMLQMHVEKLSHHYFVRATGVKHFIIKALYILMERGVWLVHCSSCYRMALRFGYVGEGLTVSQP